MWTLLRYDWEGFLKHVRAYFPAFEPSDAPDHSEGPEALGANLARRNEMTKTEAQELIEGLVLPTWFDARYATAAE